MNELKVLKIKNTYFFEGGYHYESMSVSKQEILTDKEVFRIVSKLTFKFLYQFYFSP